MANIRYTAEQVLQFLDNKASCATVGEQGLFEAAAKIVAKRAKPKIPRISECSHPQDRRQEGNKNTYHLGWCGVCGEILWCSDGGIPSHAYKKHDDWCEEHLTTWSCNTEAKGGPRCSAWCGHPNYCMVAYRDAPKCGEG